MARTKLYQREERVIAQLAVHAVEHPGRTFPTWQLANEVGRAHHPYVSDAIERNYWNAIWDLANVFHLVDWIAGDGDAEDAVALNADGLTYYLEADHG